MKAVGIAGWRWNMTSIRGREYNHLIARQNPLLALECELQGLASKGGLIGLTGRDRLRLEVIRKQMLEIKKVP